jgi:hypothetical protein
MSDNLMIDAPYPTRVGARGWGGARALRLIVVAMLACLSLCAFTASRASALSIGLMSGGISAHEWWKEPAQWDVMQKSGIKVFRLMLRPEISINTYDEVFRLAAERDITILPYLYNFENSSRFPYATAESGVGNPWELWVNFVVHRYGRGGEFWKYNSGLVEKPVQAWEVWNEPNSATNDPYFINSKKQAEERVQPELYAKFLKKTSEIIQRDQQQNTPGVGTQVLFGGLAPYGEMSIAEFISGTQKAIPTLYNYFAGLSLHPYSFRANVTGAGSFVNIVETSRNALRAAFGNKSLWLTEIGWNVTDPACNPEKAKCPAQNWVTPEQQAMNVQGSFSWVKQNAAALNIETAIYFDYRDTPEALHSWADYTGLRDTAGNFRQAWYALEEATGAPRWPNLGWQSIENLGHPASGPLTSDPDISTWGPGRLDVVARGTKNELVHLAYSTATGWSTGWESLGGTKSGELLESGPSTTSWGPYRMDIVAVGNNGNLLHWAFDGSKYVGPDNLGHPTQGLLKTSAPDISTRGANTLDVFARGPYNELFHKYYPGPAGQQEPSGWSTWEDLGHSLSGGVGAVSWGPKWIDVFGRAPSGKVNLWTWDSSGTWPWPYGELTGSPSISSDPDVSSRGENMLDLFAAGANGELLHQWYPEALGGPWENLGGKITGGPGATSWSGERIDVVGTSPTGDLLHWDWLGTPP